MAKNIRIQGGPRVDLPNGINSFTWKSNLRTSEESTVGGRVIQILGVDITGLTITAEIGSGGAKALRRLASQAAALIEWHVSSDRAARVTYPREGYDFYAFLKSVTIKDSVDNITYPVALNFEVDEDVNNIATKAAMGQELARLRDGIGYRKNSYNDLEYKGGGKSGPTNRAGGGGVTTNGRL